MRENVNKPLESGLALFLSLPHQPVCGYVVFKLIFRTRVFQIFQIIHPIFDYTVSADVFSLARASKFNLLGLGCYTFLTPFL